MTTSAPPSTLVATDHVDTELLGKRERNKLDKQQRILRAATQLFQQEGFDDTTTAEIAELAGIGAGTLYLYVESKEDLLVGAFVGVAGGAWADAFEQVDSDLPLVEQLMALFTHVTDHHVADRRLARAFFKELPFASPSVRAGTAQFNDWFVARLEALLAEAATDNKLIDSVPRDVLTHNLYALWQLQMRRLVSEAISRDDMIEELRAGVGVSLWAMTPDT